MKVQGGLISMKDVILFLKTFISGLRKKWFIILFIGIIGGTVGFLKATYTPVKYISQITFIVEESKSSGNMLNSIAGQFGFDVGSSSGSGVLNADNIIPFFRSHDLCRTVLLLPFENSNILIADKYISVYGLDKKWKKQFGQNFIGFGKSLKENKLPRLEDSLLQVVIKKWVLKNDIFIVRPDKKATFFTLVTSMRDEQLSMFFCENMLQQGVSKYLEIKTKSKLSNVLVLQKRADSLSFILREKSFSSASQQQTLLDLNPANKIEGVNYEISAREKNMVSTIFAEVIKNLEISKSMLSQETPTIQIIDKTYAPLERQFSEPYSFFALGFVITVAFYSLLALAKVLLQKGAIV